jgi:dTDP-4-dehydrorhamnose reductase
MTWLITGAGGQLGIEIQSALMHHGIKYLPLNSKELDVTNAKLVKKTIEKYQPRVIVNTAAWTDVDRAEIEKDSVFDVNANGPKYLAEAAKNFNSTLIQVSTDYVFSGRSVEPWQEDGKTEPETVYGLSKLKGEELVTEIYSENSYIVRTAWLYSGHKKNFVKTMIKLATKNDENVKVVNDQIGQPTFAKDLAWQLIYLVTAKAKFGIYHGTNGGQASWYELAREVFNLCGANSSRVIPVKSTEIMRSANRPEYSVLGHEKWENTNVSEMRHWRLALADAINEINNGDKRKC